MKENKDKLNNNNDDGFFKKNKEKLLYGTIGAAGFYSGYKILKDYKKKKNINKNLTPIKYLKNSINKLFSK